MTKKRRIRYDRIVLLVLIGIALIIALVLGTMLLLKNDNTNTVTPDNNEVIDSKDSNIELLSYDVYKDVDDSLGFNFVVVELLFKNDNGVNYDLSNLTTNEDVKLSDTYMYEKKIELEGYDFSLLNVINDVSSSEKEFTCKVFAPFTGDSLILTDLISDNTITIDTSKNEKDLSLLKINSSSTNLSSANYDLSISNSYVSDMMTRNGEDYNSSMLSIYTFDIEVKSIGDNIKLTSAVYKKKSDGESYEALDASFASRKIDNIIDKDLKVDDKYALFFEVFTDPNDKQDFSGTITFNFSDGSSKAIETVLN